VNTDTKQVLAVLERLVAAHQRGVLDYTGVIAIVLTLVVLIWYTIETHGLRVTAVKQVEHATTPILAIAPVLDRDAHPQIAIRNVGSGPAFNLSIDAATNKGCARLTFQFCDVLAGQETQPLTVTMVPPERQPEVLRHHEISEAIKLGQLPASIPVVLTYNGSSGKQYRTIMSLEHKEDLLFYRFCTHSETQ